MPLPVVPARLSRGPQIGAGGEGTVFAVSGAPDLALKVYHRPPSAFRVAKLKAMAERARPELIPFTAWPLKVFGGVGRQDLGVAMPRIRDAREINLLYAPKARARRFPEADWRFLIRVAANVAAAFAKIHEIGCVIGDVNQSSVLVRADATVALIDCDSFQFEHRGALYPCEVAVPVFTPPELQGLDPAKVRRSADHDAFGLAVLIFLLLFMGRHPFAGRPRGGDDLPIEKAIAARQFAYARDRRALRLDPPPNSLLLDDLPDPVADLFERAFGPAPGPRPEAEAWHRALRDLEGGLHVCGIEPSHAYPSERSRCPWCAIERVSGATLFKQTPLAKRSRAMVAPPAFPETSELWKPIEAALGQNPPPIPPRLNAAILSPSPAANALARAKRRDLLASGGVALGAGIAAVIGAGVPAALAAPIALVLGFGAVRQMHLRLRGAVEALRRAYATALIEREALERDWSSLTRQSASRDHAALTRARDQYEALVRPWLTARRAQESSWRNDHRRWRSALVSEAGEIRQRLPDAMALNLQMRNEELVATYRAQLGAHLDAHLIANASIDQIGQSRVATLRSFQIESAADVTRRAVSAVPGFGDFLTKKLLSWRAEVERAFVFDPAVARAALSEGVVRPASPPPRPVAPSLPEGAVDLLRALEAELRAAPARLAAGHARTQGALKGLAAEAERLAMTLAQAEADLNAIDCSNA